jgi:hypothetical protein
MRKEKTTLTTYLEIEPITVLQTRQAFGIKYWIWSLGFVFWQFGMPPQVGIVCRFGSLFCIPAARQ